jgi:hypothetical protein
MPTVFCSSSIKVLLFRILANSNNKHTYSYSLSCVIVLQYSADWIEWKAFIHHAPSWIVLLYILSDVLLPNFSNKIKKIFNVYGSVHCNNILINIQQYAHSLFYLKTSLHISSGTSTHHQERKQLSTASGICHAVTATCRKRQVAVTVWQIPDTVDTVACAPDDGWWSHPKHVEQFPDKINCVTLHLVGYNNNNNNVTSHIFEITTLMTPTIVEVFDEDPSLN